MWEFLAKTREQGRSVLQILPWKRGFQVILLVAGLVSVAVGSAGLIQYYFFPTTVFSPDLTTGLIRNPVQATNLDTGLSQKAGSNLDASSDPNQEISVQVEPVIVSVTGAVVKPGIVELEAGQRWAQAVQQAGGPAPKADIRFLNQKLNLAQVVKDGEQIYIPFEGEENPGEVDTDMGDTNTGSHISSNQQVSLNSASLSQLQELEGIGEKRAQDIMGGRPYQSIQELVERGIVTEKIFAAIQNNLIL